MTLITGNTLITGYTKIGYGLLLDTIPDCQHALSYYKQRSDYSGPSIRIQRASDGAVLDVGFAYDQNRKALMTDWNAVTAFKGASTIKEIIHYDQSIYGRHVTYIYPPGFVPTPQLDPVNGFPCCYHNGLCLTCPFPTATAVMGFDSQFFSSFMIKTYKGTTNNYSILASDENFGYGAILLRYDNTGGNTLITPMGTLQVGSVHSLLTPVVMNNNRVGTVLSSAKNNGVPTTGVCSAGQISFNGNGSGTRIWWGGPSYGSNNDEFCFSRLIFNRAGGLSAAETDVINKVLMKQCGLL